MSDGVLRVGVKSLATDRIQNLCRGVAGSGFYYLFSWALSGCWRRCSPSRHHYLMGICIYSSDGRRHRFSLFIFIYEFVIDPVMGQTCTCIEKVVISVADYINLYKFYKICTYPTLVGKLLFVNSCD